MWAEQLYRSKQHCGVQSRWTLTAKGKMLLLLKALKAGMWMSYDSTLAAACWVRIWLADGAWASLVDLWKCWINSGCCVGWGSDAFARRSANTLLHRPPPPSELRVRERISIAREKSLPTRAQNVQFLSSYYHWISISLWFVKGLVSNSPAFYFSSNITLGREKTIPWKDTFQSRAWCFFHFFFFSFDCSPKYKRKSFRERSS